MTHPTQAGPTTWSQSNCVPQARTPSPWVTVLAFQPSVSIWSMLKRGYYGIFHKLSPKHLDRYVQGFAVWHYLRAGHHRRDERGSAGHGRQAAQVRGPDPREWAEFQSPWISALERDTLDDDRVPGRDAAGGDQ